MFATEELNQDLEMLQNKSLGFRIYDTCYSEVKALEGTIGLLSGQAKLVPNYHCGSQAFVSAIIGDESSLTSLPMARLLGIYRYPQVSYGATLSLLNDKAQFPSFVRTAPNDNILSSGLAHLILHFGWTWVGILAADNDYGRQGSDRIIKELRSNGACLALFETLPLHSSDMHTLKVADKIISSTTTVILAYSTQQELSSLMVEVTRKRITGKVWLAPDGWSISLDLFPMEVWKTLNGSLGFAYHKGQISGFTEFVYNIHPSQASPDDIFIITFWEEAFGCRWRNVTYRQNTDSTKAQNDIRTCTGEEKIENLKSSVLDVFNLRFVYNLYNSVHAVAHALHDLITCRPNKSPFINNTCPGVESFQPWQVLHYLRHVRFENKAGEEIFFDDNGDPQPYYDILNWQLIPGIPEKYAKVGKYTPQTSPGQGIVINKTAIMWNQGVTDVPQSVCNEKCPLGYRKSMIRGMPLCCYDCILCPPGEIANQTDSNNCLKCSADHWSNERFDRCIPKVVEFLSFEEPMGSALTSISIFASCTTAVILCVFFKHRDTPVVKANNRSLSYLLLLSLTFCFLCSLIFIGYPKNINCLLHQVTFGVTFSLCVSCILAKTITVVIAFSATNPNSKLRSWVRPKTPNIILIFCLLVQVIICIAWLGSAPPYPEQDMTFNSGRIILRCNEGAIVSFYCMLGYMGLLASVSFIVAFLARHLPDAFNEAKYITFSMLVFVCVWISFIPAYLSTQGKYMVAVEIFAIISSGLGILGCIYFPKCYIIILRPEINTKGHFGRKQDLHRH
ncbi:extracellular calcium-sensing receptor-like [Protopterus annectens]|uniref:extracellular calcium-sensing receptor-like n=1 Tax=Protopterus annectens TaxID=7888 RepID=UPI001CFB8FF2|nr:extracellular calcium-sensing receptor-like [Protopterus annectens]